MSREEYSALGEKIRGEYVDGHLVVSPSATLPHQTIARRLANAIEEVLPSGVRVATEWAWKPGDDEFIPDVIVFDDHGETVRYTHTPHLVIEILSDDRARDLVRKSHRYALAGPPRYWEVDPDGPVVSVFSLIDGVYAGTGWYGPDQHIQRDIGPAIVSLSPGDLPL